MKVEGLLGFLGAALGIGFSLMVLVIPDISQALEEESFFLLYVNDWFTCTFRSGACRIVYCFA